MGALVFTLSSAIVHFLIRNLSNRSVHLRVTEKPPPFSLTAFPLPPVLQQPRSSFEFAPGNGRTRVTQYLKKKSAEESGRSIKDKVFILPKQNEFLNLFSKDKCICLDTISSHLLCSTRGHLWLPKHHTPPNSKVLFFQFEISITNPSILRLRPLDHGPDFCGSRTKLGIKSSVERACTPSVFFYFTLQHFQDLV